MGASLKGLLTALLEILGWHEAGAFYDWIEQSRWGKKVLTGIGALVLGAIGYATRPPTLGHVAVGRLIGWLLTRVATGALVKYRRAQIDWQAVSFQLPIEISGGWLVGLTYPEPLAAFTVTITNATERLVEITGVSGSVNITGPCNAPARLASYHRLTGIKCWPQIGSYEVSIEQPVTRENADSISATLNRSDGFIRFGLAELQLVGTVALATSNIVAVENCYLERTSRGTLGVGSGVRGPLDLTPSDEQIGRPEACVVSLRICDARGRSLPPRNENANAT